MEVIMAKKEKIPCRVCGKLFEPCGYCQEHSEVFKWRNFACSRECAQKYIADTIAYRESLRKKSDMEPISKKDISVKRADTTKGTNVVKQSRS